MPSSHVSPPSGRIGEYLHCSPADIEWAVSVQDTELSLGNVKHIGEILVERERISSEELADALKAQLIDRLRRCRFLTNLSEDDLVKISEITEEIRLREGEDLLKEDQRGDSLYVVATGRVVIYQGHQHSEWIPIGTAQPGDVLGEMGYFSDGTRLYSAGAVEPTVLLRIRYDQLTNLASLLPHLAVELLNVVTERMRESNVLCADDLPERERLS